MREMEKATAIVSDKLGLHIRLAAEIVEIAAKHQVELTLENTRTQKKASAKSVLNLVGIRAKCGDTLKFEISGKTQLAEKNSLKEILAVL